MTTVQADVTALTFNANELAVMETRSTSGPNLKAVITQLIADLNASLTVAHGMCESSNQTAIETIQAKLLP